MVATLRCRRGAVTAGAGGTPDDGVGRPTGVPAAGAAVGGTSPLRSPPVSLTRSANGRRAVYRTTETEQGSTTRRWKASRCMPSASASTALMTSPWETASQSASGPCSAGHGRVVFAHRGHGPYLHPQHRLPAVAGERHRGGVCLHHPPQRVLDQFLQRPAGPGAVPALPEPLIRERGGAGNRARPGQRHHRGGGLLAALQRAGHHRTERERRQPPGEGLSLGAAGVVEPDPRRPAGQHTAGVGTGASVADQDQRWHPPSLRVERPGRATRRAGPAGGAGGCGQVAFTTPAASSPISASPASSR